MAEVRTLSNSTGQNTSIWATHRINVYKGILEIENETDLSTLLYVYDSGNSHQLDLSAS